MKHRPCTCVVATMVSTALLSVLATGCTSDETSNNEPLRRSLSGPVETAATSEAPADRNAEARMDEQTQAVVAGIRQREDAIRDIRMRCRIYSPEQAPADADNFLARDMEWAFAKDGKELMAGESHDASRPGSPPQKFKTAYDGNQMVSLSDTRKWRSGVLTEITPVARITAYNPGIFRGNETPGTLMGLSLKRTGHESLSQVLRQSKQLRITNDVNAPDGVVVLDAEQIYVVHGNTYDARLWIDTKRGHSLLRADMFMHVTDPSAEAMAKLNFKNPVNSVYDVELKQIDGHWMPIEGWHTTYSQRATKPFDGAAMQRRKISEAQWLAEHGVTATSSMPRHIVVDPQTVKINQDIPIEAFQVELPNGTKVFDELHGGETNTVGE